jgi:adenosine deaminase
VGIFGSPLSNEYLIAAQHFQLNHDELLDLYRNAIDTIFGGEQEKTRLKRLLDSYRASLSGGLSI